MDQYCRLCLSITTEHFYEISNSKYRKQLETVIPELNINSVHAPLLCQKCCELLEEAYKLKTHSLRVDKYLTIFVEMNNTDVVTVSEILNITKEMDGNFHIGTTDDISFVDVRKIEENDVLSDDPLTETIPFCVKTESVELNEDLYEEKYSVDISEPQIVVSDKDSESTDNLIKMEAEVSENSDIANSNKYNCFICVKTFETYNRLKQHRLMHQKQGIKVHKCEIAECTESFFTKRELVEHKRRHSQLKCKTCGHISDTYRTYQYHIKKHSPLYKCEKCGVQFPTPAQVRSHDVVHTGLREFVCDICGKKFGQSATLHTHVNRVHATEKPFPCEICGKRFTAKIPRKQHMIMMHLDPDRKKFTCEICGKTIKSKSSLYAHYKRHSGEKPHACKFCDKRFVDASALRKHLLTHGNENPHVCPYCSKKTNQKYNLTVHMRTCPKKKENAVTVENCLEDI